MIKLIITKWRRHVLRRKHAHKRLSMSQLTRSQTGEQAEQRAFLSTKNDNGSNTDVPKPYAVTKHICAKQTKSHFRLSIVIWCIGN